MRLYASHRPMTSASEGAALAQRIRKAAQLQAALKTKDQVCLTNVVMNYLTL
jgi:hypothetical protein